jgi:hypothetical protein
MATPYLSSRTEQLSAGAVPPDLARAAQIPLTNFELPTFPEEAFSSGKSIPLLSLQSPGSKFSAIHKLTYTPGLEALILTSDIKLDEYTSLLTQPFSIPNLPSSITSLTLELFSLGYPPAFLSELGKQLKRLKALTLYSQLFAGTTRDSHDDAVAFVKAQKALREVHFLDVFAEKAVFGEVLGEFSTSCSISLWG